MSDSDENSDWSVDKFLLFIIVLVASLVIAWTLVNFGISFITVFILGFLFILTILILLVFYSINNPDFFMGVWARGQIKNWRQSKFSITFLSRAKFEISRIKRIYYILNRKGDSDQQKELQVPEAQCYEIDPSAIDRASLFDLCMASDGIKQHDSNGVTVWGHAAGDSPQALDQQLKLYVTAINIEEKEYGVDTVTKSSPILVEKVDQPPWKDFVESSGKIETMEVVANSQNMTKHNGFEFTFTQGSVEKDHGEHVSAIDHMINKLKTTTNNILVRLTFVRDNHDQGHQSHTVGATVFGKSVENTSGTLAKESSEVASTLIPPSSATEVVNRNPEVTPNPANPHLWDSQKLAKANVMYPDLRPAATGQTALRNQFPFASKQLNKNRGAVSKIPMTDTDIKWYLGPSKADQQVTYGPQ